MTKENAEKQAIAAGLHYQFFIEPSDKTKGTVFKQSPTAGTDVKKGDSVTFWVSKGK